MGPGPSLHKTSMDWRSLSIRARDRTLIPSKRADSSRVMVPSTPNNASLDSETPLAETWQEAEEEEDYLAEDDMEDEYDDREDEDFAAAEELPAADEPVYPINRDEPTMAAPAAPTAPTAPDAAGKADNSNSSGISRIVIAVIVLSAIGFTASNWMANQKIDTLTARLENVEALLNDNSAGNQGQQPPQGAQQNEAFDQKNEAVLMQLSAQTMENRDAIETLRQAMAEAAKARASEAKTAAAGSGKPAATAEAPAKEATPAASKSTETAPAAKQAASESNEQPAPKTASPASTSAKKGKGWNVVLMSLKNEEMAERELAALKKNGVQAEIHAVKVKGTIYHQLRLGWFEQKDDALQYIKDVVKDLGYKDAWIRQTD